MGTIKLRSQNSTHIFGKLCGYFWWIIIFYYYCIMTYFHTFCCCFPWWVSRNVKNYFDYHLKSWPRDVKKAISYTREGIYRENSIPHMLFHLFAGTNSFTLSKWWLLQSAVNIFAVHIYFKIDRQFLVKLFEVR